jgi:hypothetical protein
MSDLDALENYNYLWDDVWMITEKERDNEEISRPGVVNSTD